MTTRRRCLAYLALAAVLSGCRQQDIRTFQVRLQGVEGTNDQERIQMVLSRMDGVQRDSIRFYDFDQVELRYDSMKLAKRNIEYAIAGAGYGANDIPAGQVPEEDRRVSAP